MRELKHGATTDSAVLIFVRMVTVAISIIIYKMLTTYFSLEEYGVYSSAMLIVATATSFSVLGLTDALNYFYNQKKEDSSSEVYVQTIFAIQIFAGVICTILVFALKKQIINYFGTDDVGDLLPYIAFLPMLTNLLGLFQVLFISCKKAKIIAIRNLIFSVVKVLFVGVSCYVFKNISIVVITTLVIDVLSIVYMMNYCSKKLFSINIHLADFRLTKEICMYGVPMAAYIITNSLSRNIDKLIVGQMGTVEELAVYTVAAKELPFDILTSSFITVLIPYITRFIAKKDYKGAGNAFSKYIQLTYTIIWIVAFGAIVCSKDLMLILYDEKYLPGINVFVMYIIVDMIRFANVSLIFSAKAKTNELLCYSGVALAFNCVLNIVLYKIFGMVGSALSNVLITMLLSVIMLLRSCKLLNSNAVEIINIKRMIVVLFECSICAWLAYVISREFFTYENVLLRFVITYLIYFLPIMFLNYKNIIRLLKEINKIKLC